MSGRTTIGTLKYMIETEKAEICPNNCFSSHNVLRQVEEICLKPISIAVNHSITLLRYVVT